MFDKLWIQRMYADNVGARLERWTVQSYSPYRSNFRCPICGDSQKNRFKKRGYIIEKTGYLVFHCHNACGTMGFEKFLRQYYGDIYTMYKFDLLKHLAHEREEEEEIVEIEEEPDNTLDDNQLPIGLICDNPEGLEYIRGRQIESRFWDDIYYTDKFYGFVNDVVENKFPDHMVDRIEKRVVLPMRDYDGTIFGVIGRALNPKSEPKYLTIKLDPNKPKIFGLDRVNLNQPIYIAEGPIDSFFIDNGVAFAGTDGNPDDIPADKTNKIIVLDNQPRAKDVVLKYKKYISMGYKMVIWPTYIEHKDVNDMIMYGNFTREQLNTLIRANTFGGALLNVKFSNWRKVNV